MDEEIMNRLITQRGRGQIQVEFNISKKSFRLSVPIFSTNSFLPKCIEDYVEARKDKIFKPHSTSFRIDAHKVFICQEIPFLSGFQETLRGQVDAFWQMAKQCKQMLKEMASEEDLQHLDVHLKE